MQIVDGKYGYLVDSVEAAAKRTADLLRNPTEAEAMGEAGRDHVRRNFLSTRELEDWLRLFGDLG
jgi:trehalose synthase